MAGPRDAKFSRAKELLEELFSARRKVEGRNRVTLARRGSGSFDVPTIASLGIAPVEVSISTARALLPSTSVQPAFETFFEPGSKLQYVAPTSTRPATTASTTPTRVFAKISFEKNVPTSIPSDARCSRGMT